MLPRSLRVYLLGCIAITVGYWLLHAGEPLRLNVGDPGSDANVLSSIALADPGDADPPPEHADRLVHDRSLPEIVYGALGARLGVSDIAPLRWIALACSALALWLLFQYSRRLWNGTVALIATALFATSVLWMMHADSLHPAPITQASCFLALWGVVRSIETRQRRHHAAAFLGSSVCYLSSHDYWLFLPAAALFTVHVRLGNPFARDTRRFLVACAAGCLTGLLAKALFAVGAGGWHEPIGRQAASSLPILLRRYSLVFTPMFWVTFGHTMWKALRAPSPRSVLEDGVTWMLVAAAIPLYALSRSAGSHLLSAQPLLPFYAIGSALLIDRLLGGLPPRRGLAIAWLACAPAWSFNVMLRHPRSVLDRDDVARVNAYFAASDRNDFVMSNLMSDGPLQASFQRHNWAAFDAAKTADTPLAMLELFEATGTDYVHAVIFSTPDSRFTDDALWSLTMRRPLWSVTGWPHLNRGKTNKIIRAYDKNVRRHLEVLHAKQVLHVSNFDVYRIDRETLVEAMGRSIPVVKEVDFGSIEADQHKLVGWAPTAVSEDTGIGVTSIAGHDRCPNPAIDRAPGAPGRNSCKTVPTRRGLTLADEGRADSAQLMIRVERPCDLRLTVEFAAPALLRLSMNGFATPQCAPAARASFVIPQRAVRAGINVLTFEQRFGPLDSTADLSALTIEPTCDLNRSEFN